MTNRHQTAVNRLAARLKASASDSVTYARGGDSLAGLAATIGTSDHDDTGPEGMPLMVQSVDFIVTAADLILDASAVEPAKGDLITWESRTYEVRPFGSQRQAWRFADSHQTIFRIHTIQTS